MASAHTIQSGSEGTENNISPRPLVASTGRLYSTYEYTTGGIHYLAVSYSDDNGSTWSETRTALAQKAKSVDAAIDSLDIIHIAYGRTSDILSYRTFSSGVFGTEVDVFVGTTSLFEITIVVDGSDIPHIAWSQNVPATTDKVIYYTNRSGGSWATRTRISDESSQTRSLPRMVIDSHGYIYVFFIKSSSAAQMVYTRYTTSWLAETVVPTDGVEAVQECYPAIDSLDNIHLVYRDTTGTDAIRYQYYTYLTDTWSSRTSITTTNVDGTTKASVGITTDDVLHVVYNDSSTGIYYTEYTGSWSVPTSIYTPTGNPTLPTLYTPLYPRIQGVRTAIPLLGYQFIFSDTPSALLRFLQSTGTILQTPVTKNYSRKASASLPSNDNNLSNLFTASEYTDVAVDDGLYADQTATDQYAIVQFRNRSTNSSDLIYVSWTGKSSIAPSASAVYLQIYNRNSSTWETLSSDNASSANADFTLTGSQLTNLSNYYNGTNWISCRVYQLAQ